MGHFVDASLNDNRVLFQARDAGLDFIGIRQTTIREIDCLQRADPTYVTRFAIGVYLRPRWLPFKQFQESSSIRQITPNGDSCIQLSKGSILKSPNTRKIPRCAFTKTLLPEPWACVPG